MQGESTEEQKKNIETSYIKYFINYIPSEIQKIAEEELGETEEVKVRCLQELRELIKDSEPDFNPCTDEIFLMRFLRCRKYDVKRAFANLVNYYNLKARYSGILFDFTPLDLKHILDKCNGYGLEHRAPNHVGIALFRIGQYDLDEVNTDEVFATTLLLGESVMNCEATQITGYSSIVDMSNLSLGKLSHFASPSLIRRFVTCIQDTLPIRLNCVHFVNNSFYVNVIISIAKQCLSEKLRERVHVHGSNLDSLHKFFPPEILPEELGGKQGPCAKYAKIFLQKMYDEEEYYVRMKSFGYSGEKLKKLQEDNDLVDST